MAPWNTSTSRLASGRRGTLATLKAMYRLAGEGSRDPEVIRAAQSAVRRTRERDDLATVTDLLSDVRRRMRYTPDPLDVELVKAPRVVVEQSGLYGVEPMDCDDASTLLGAFLGAVGIPYQFTVVAADRSRPREWSHVYVTAMTRDGPVPLDPIVRSMRAGDEVPSDRINGPRGYYPGGANMIGCEGCPRNTNIGIGEYRRRRRAGMGFIGVTAEESFAAQRAASGYSGSADSSYDAFKAGGLTQTSDGDLLDSAGNLITKGTDAYIRAKRIADRLKILRGGGTTSPVVVKPPRVKRGFFQKKVGGVITTDWVKVGGAVVVVGGLVYAMTRLGKRR